MPDIKPDVALPARTIWDQHDLDCCMSCALVTCLEALHADWPALAPLFHYFHGRRFPEVLEGMDELQAFSAASRHGFCKLPLHDYRFDDKGAHEEPDEDAKTDGKTRLFLQFVNMWIAPYQTVFIGDREHLWKTALDSGKPVYLGLHLDSTYNELWNQGAPAVWKNSGATLTNAYHAAAILGYAESLESFVVQDSRGANFGQKGQWFLPYKTVQSPRIRFAYSIGL